MFIKSVDHDHHSSLGISGSICPECVVELDHPRRDSSRFLSMKTCDTHLDLAPRSVRTVFALVFRPLLLCRLVGVCKFCRGFLVGLVNVLLALLGLQGVLSLVFLCRLAQGLFQLAVDDHWLRVPFTRALACFRVPDVGTVLVDNVEAFSFVQNFRNVLDCCSVSGSTVVKLEACQRSTVCTPLHRHDRHRCISHLEVDLSVCTAGSQRCTTHTAQWQLSSGATISY